MKKLVGLTGGIASGKSVVARTFSEAGFCILDFDILAAELRDTNKEVQNKLTAAFGTYDRFALRNTVFRNTGTIAIVNEIFFKPILALAHKKTEESTAPVVIWDTALLLDFPEDLIPKEMEQIFVVHCPREIRKARLLKRHVPNQVPAPPNSHTSQVSEEVAEHILNIQISDEKRLELAKAHNASIIYSDTSIEDLQATVKKVAKELLLP